MAGWVLLACGLAWPGELPAAEATGVRVLSHDMTVTLDPERHALQATDRMTLAGSPPDTVSFSLNPSLRVESVHAVGASGPRPLAVTKQAGGTGHEAAQHITVQLGRTPADRSVVLEWIYEGTINDPPRDRGQLRFVAPSETTGHIGPEGIYLSGETHWYPDVPRSLATFRVRVTTPKGWEAVTHGRQVSRSVNDRTVAEWEVTAPTEALTLVANRFVKAQRDWKDPSGTLVEVAAYLLPDNAPLAGEYLEASVRYLGLYAGLLGPYPFPKFAVVENFFPSGLGMPSFTLLGGGVIKRHYVQPYALGHEIVHSWIGNHVFNDVEQGNWVEGLTTYLANYYHEELTGPPEKAMEQRRMMVWGYAVYVRPDDDYPIAGFRTKRDQRDNAIGYQKAAMVFHMLRREIGDERFFRGIRTLVADRGGKYADWNDLIGVYSEIAGRDLRWFFAQWVERPGAPELQIQAVRVEADPERAGRYRVRAKLRQLQPSPYRLTVRLVAAGEGREEPIALSMTAAEADVRATVGVRPATLALDPGFETFRRLSREELPPMLNLFVTDTRRAVIGPGNGAEADRAPYQELLARVTAREPDSAASPVTAVKEGQALPVDHSVLVLGGPGLNPHADWAVRGCGDRVGVRADGFRVAGQDYGGPGLAVLVSCRIPEQPGRIATLFYGTTPQAASQVGRLLFFYGWQSYLVFRDGTVVARGDFAPTDHLEVRLEQ